jgi:hypothetical protein
MTTKRQIIEMSYSAVGLAGFIYDIQPEQIESARRMLDAMMAGWNARGLRVSWPIPSGPDRGDVDEETNLPDSALEAVYLNLGPLLANMHGKQVTPMYLGMARAAKDTMMISLVQPAKLVMPGGHPLGAGHKSYYGPAWSADPDPYISTGNDELEL